jgi:hypothetical protein
MARADRCRRGEPGPQSGCGQLSGRRRSDRMVGVRASLAYNLRRRFPLRNVQLIPPEGRSKTARLFRHLDVIHGGKIRRCAPGPALARDARRGIRGNFWMGRSMIRSTPNSEDNMAHAATALGQSGCGPGLLQLRRLLAGERADAGFAPLDREQHSEGVACSYARSPPGRCHYRRGGRRLSLLRAVYASAPEAWPEASVSARCISVAVSAMRCRLVGPQRRLSRSRTANGLPESRTGARRFPSSRNCSRRARGRAQACCVFG